MVKIALDAGHGLHTPGKRTPDGEREWSFNNKVLLAAVERLNQYENVQILRLDDPTGKTDVPLRTRTNKANKWKADVLVSIHHNANTSKWGSWGGVETFTHPQSSKASKDIAKIINPMIVKAMGLRDRGVKTSNLHMVRESNMPSILTEGGFMDSLTDIKALRDDSKLKAQGYAIADGLAQYFKLKPKYSQSNNKKGELTMSQYEELKKEIEALKNYLGSDRPVSPTFKDSWKWVEEKGLMDGSNPSRPISREQFATVLNRYNESNSLSPTTKKDLKELFENLYEDKLFLENHADKVDSMPEYEIVNKLSSVLNRFYNDYRKEK